MNEALRLEERKVAQAWDKLRRDTEEKNRAIAERWGPGSGGVLVWELTRNLMDQLEQQVERAAAIHRDLSGDVPALGDDERIEAWKARMHETVKAWGRDGIAASVARLVGVQHENEVRKSLEHGEWAARLASIRAVVDREAESMKEEQRLGVGRRRAGVNVNIQGSTVGAINLGVIEGDLNATISNLRAQGSADIATHLDRLREAVKNSDALRDRRGEVLQALTTIAQEAEQPPDRRKPAVVKMLLDSLAPNVATVAALTEIWHAAYPAIAHFFGFH